MSIDRHTAPELAAPGYARCPKQPRDSYVRLYLGKQRAPCRPDERGALCVVELIAGDSALIFVIPGDSEFRRVLILRDVPNPRGAKAAHAQAARQGGSR